MHPQARRLAVLHGLVAISLSTLCAAFGNSLEPVGILSFLQILLTLYTFDWFWKWAETPGWRTIGAIMITVSQAVGTTVGFADTLGDPKPSPLSVMITFCLSLALWILFIFVSFRPRIVLFSLLGDSVFTHVYAFPILFCSCSTLFRYAMGTFTSFAVPYINITPLLQLTSLFGLFAIEFTVALLVSLIVAYGSSAAQGVSLKLKRHSARLVVLFSLLFIFVGSRDQLHRFYQKDIAALVPPTLQASCITTEKSLSATTEALSVFRKRVEAGDDIILTSELFFLLDTEDEYLQFLAQIQNISSLSNKSYIAVTYKRLQPQHTNNFLMVAPGGNVAWNYAKSHPVPYVERDIVAGPAVLPTFSSTLGKLGGAICFDADFSNFIRQAGHAQVDLLLQPSSTWGAIAFRHFAENAVRALENGFTLLRCSSHGMSGAVGPYGTVWSQFYSVDRSLTVFPVPLAPRVSTLYVNGGWIVEWACVVLALMLAILSWLPPKVAEMIVSRLGLGSNSHSRTAGQYEALPILQDDDQHVVLLDGRQ